MELNDVLRRLLGHHWELIALCALVCGTLVVLIHRGEDVTYTAASRIVLDAPDPKSAPEAAAISDIARAIATSPSQVRDALRAARASGRDPVEVAEERVGVRGLGGSNVIQISVTDTDPAAAAAIANALGAQLIRTRLRLSRGQIEDALEVLDRRIDTLNRRISKLNADADSLVLAAALAADPARSGQLRARREEVARSRDALTQQRARREGERSNLLSSLSGRPRPSVISPATPPAAADPSGLLPAFILALVLGGVVGVGLAGLLETMQPTLVGSDAVARELDAPLLGALHAGPAYDMPEDKRRQLAGRLRMAAGAAHVRCVALMPADARAELGTLAMRLDAAPVEAGDESRDGERPGDRFDQIPETAVRVVDAPTGVIPIRASHIANPALSNGGAMGLVIVAPSVVKKSQLADARHLLRASPAPLLGVLTYPPGAPRRARRPL